MVKKRLVTEYVKMNTTKSVFCFKCRAFQLVLASIWGLRGDLVTSLCLKLSTKHQVCVGSLTECILICNGLSLYCVNLYF